MFVRLFRIKASDSLKNLAGAIYEEENGETETERALYNLRMPNFKKSSQQLPLCVTTTRLAVFAKMF